MVQFACFRKGPGLEDALIRIVTYSRYHHIAIRFTAPVVVEVKGSVYDIKAGELFEARPGGVCRLKNLDDRHDPGQEVDFFEYKMPLMHHEVQDAAAWLVSQLGKPYDLLNDARFVPLIRLLVPEPKGWDRTHVYCSELAVEMSRQIKRPIIERCLAWQVPPRDIPRCPLLRHVATEVVRPARA